MSSKALLNSNSVMVFSFLSIYWSSAVALHDDRGFGQMPCLVSTLILCWSSLQLYNFYYISHTGENTWEQPKPRT